MQTGDEDLNELKRMRQTVAALHLADFEVIAQQAKAFVNIMGEDPELVLLDGMAFLVAGVHDLKEAHPEVDSTAVLSHLLAAALGELTVAVRMLAEGLHKSPEEIVKELVEQALRVE